MQKFLHQNPTLGILQKNEDAIEVLYIDKKHKGLNMGLFLTQMLSYDFGRLQIKHACYVEHFHGDFASFLKA